MINVFSGLCFYGLTVSKVLHLDYFNPNYSYAMADITLQDLFEEKDPAGYNYQQGFETAAVINKANRLLGLIKKCFVNTSIKSFILFCTSLICSCLEYSNIALGPFYVCSYLIENIQHSHTHTHAHTHTRTHTHTHTHIYKHVYRHSSTEAILRSLARAWFKTCKKVLA